MRHKNVSLPFAIVADYRRKQGDKELEQYGSGLHARAECKLTSRTKNSKTDTKKRRHQETGNYSEGRKGTDQSKHSHPFFYNDVGVA